MKIDIAVMKKKLSVMRINDVARQTGLSRYTLYRFVSDDCDIQPNLSTLEKIQKFLDSLEKSED